jgi:FKBP-type peptidyl-prolyl cis-trans isomerase
MRVWLWYGKNGGGLVGCVLAGVLGLVLVGCDAPDIMPVSPPGAPIPRVSPDTDASSAQGEMAAPTIRPETAAVEAIDYTPAAPTAKGETKSTKRGVKYETLKEGTGPELKPGQKAQFIYVGKLLEGDKVFDERGKVGPPAIFTIGREVIGGWQEALPGMKTGETRKLIIPPELGYGANGQPPKIPPNATLLFEVELVKIIGS